jgi:hypothetical protein
MFAEKCNVSCARLQVWNSIGIVRCYSAEDGNSIDVEFHDTSLHHSLHINNFLKHTMATLTDEVLALASEIQDETPRYICREGLVCLWCQVKNALLGDKIFIGPMIS